MTTIEENIQTVLTFVNARNSEMIALFSRILDPDVVAYFLMPVEHGPSLILEDYRHSPHLEQPQATLGAAVRFCAQIAEEAR